MYTLVTKLLPRSEKIQLHKFYLLSIISMILESISLGSIFPLLIYIFDENNDKLQAIINKINFYFPSLSTQEHGNIFLSLFFIIFILKNIYLFFFKYWKNKFVNHLTYKLETDRLTRYLYEDYEQMNHENQGTKIRNIKIETSRYGKFMQSYFELIVETMVAIGIFLILIYLEQEIFYT